MGIRAKMNFSIILLLLLMTVFFDLTVYQIYKQDIEAKEIAYYEFDWKCRGEPDE